ncbi:MAG: hypothetical protein M9913_09470 [Bryobacteraceae bacterium]|nr:hypothetical protein [Solibacteraceae bacterium]MCO5351112.1 hypothetical protein [Bryobacteraceae bacterium]
MSGVYQMAGLSLVREGLLQNHWYSGDIKLPHGQPPPRYALREAARLAQAGTDWTIGDW